MIVNQKMDHIKGLIEYSYSFEEQPDMTDDDGSLFETDVFLTLQELMGKLHSSQLEEIKKKHKAKHAWISAITMMGVIDDGKSSVDLSLYHDGIKKGFVSTHIAKEEIDHQLLDRIGQIKTLVDNMLE